MIILYFLDSHALPVDMLKFWLCKLWRRRKPKALSNFTILHCLWLNLPIYIYIYYGLESPKLHTVSFKSAHWFQGRRFWWKCHNLGCYGGSFLCKIGGILSEIKYTWNSHATNFPNKCPSYNVFLFFSKTKLEPPQCVPTLYVLSKYKKNKFFLFFI